MSAVANPLREGTAGHLAIEAVREKGPMAPLAIAIAIDRPVDSVEKLLGYPVRLGLLRIDESGRYALGHGVAEPQADVVPPPPRRKYGPSVPITEPSVESALDAAGARAAPVDVKVGINADPERPGRQVDAALPAPVLATASRAEPAAPPPTTVAEMARRALGRSSSAPRPQRMVAAWRSDGSYVIEKGGARIVLDAGEAQELFTHLAKVARAA